MPNFKALRIVDNFYQTSSFFPMPTVLIGTVADDGSTSVGAYSLCFPYYVAGKDYYAMLLECRNSSNTAQNILKRGQCSLNFLQDSRKYFKETVRLGFPGDSSADKMTDFMFTLIPSSIDDPDRPMIIEEAFQVFECTWDSDLDGASHDQAGLLEGYEPPYHDFNGITSKMGAHFILKIDKILMEASYHNAILNGVNARNFPKVPVDYGYRDSTHFWYTKFPKAIGQKVPSGKEMPVEQVIYAADKIDPDIKFTKEACSMLVKVPRVFLKVVLNGSVDYAKSHNITLITKEVMKDIQDKR